MYSLKVISNFAAAHRLRNHHGKCEALHGHNWRVEVKVKANDVEKNGMVIDFSKLKSILEQCLDGLDHCYLNEIPLFDKENPTSELIAHYIFYKIKDKLPHKVSVSEVSVWESENTCAIYWEKKGSL
jgi:6-pyruvoyltetrahydropterin/6-carboxytetrahydropterin synthase